MIKRLDYKVPGGKLIRIKADLENGQIRVIAISGDFFIHPEDVLTGLEDSLKGILVSDVHALSDAIDSALAAATLIGFSKQDILTCISRID